MDILVIGNGFDLAHGLLTGYKNFLDFMKNINENNIESEQIFHDLKQCCKSNCWLKYFYNHQKDINGNWVDFEAEISKVVISMEYAKEIGDNLKKHNGNLVDFDRNANKEKIYEEICKLEYFNNTQRSYYGNTKEKVLVIKNMKYYIDKLNDDLVELIWCLEIYLGKVMDDMCLSKMKKISELSNKCFDRVLSFNYTNTFEKLEYNLRPMIMDDNTKKIDYSKQVDYIHGKMDLSLHKAKEDNNMVLGIDEYLNNDEKNIKLEFIKFKKYFQRIYKKTGNEYVKWIKYMNENQNVISNGRDDLFDNHIYIFGHSLDISDNDVLEKLILKSGFVNQKCEYTNSTQVIIYYYDEGAYAQQIANLVRIIGQDELNSRVSGENPTIVFKKQV